MTLRGLGHILGGYLLRCPVTLIPLEFLVKRLNLGVLQPKFSVTGGIRRRLSHILCVEIGRPGLCRLLGHVVEAHGARLPDVADADIHR